MPLKLAMLGITQSHAHGLVRQIGEHPDEFRLVGLHDPDPAAVADRRQRWEPLVGALTVYPTPEALLQQDLDGVAVESPVPLSMKFARLALERGRSVMLEKPAGDDLAEHRRLIELAQRKHLHVQMLYLFRYMVAVREMLDRARKGQLGRIYHFRARLPKDLPSYRRYEAEVGRFKGGMFYEMAGHVIDMMVTILGKPKAITPFLAHHHAEPGAFIDNGVAVFTYEHAWGIIEVPALETAPHSRRIEVFGTEGSCVIPHLGSGHLANKNIQPIEVFRNGAADWQQLDLQARPLQLDDLREFAAVTAGKKAPDYSMEHDLVVQEALLRASGMAPA